MAERIDDPIIDILNILVDTPGASDEDISLILGLSPELVASLIEEYNLEELAEEEYELRVRESESEIDESMDGDAASALASAGFGTDEDYGYIAENDYYD